MSFLTVEKCTKRFSGLTALSGVSISIGQGEIIGLIGPNGSGKTTLFNVISGFYSADKGSILFKGNRINDFKPHHISRMGICRTFQIPKPFGGISVFHNILVGITVKESNVTKATQKTHELLSFMGLDARASVFAKNLPIAERKKLEIAKGLSTNPEVLLLDEVMSGLTPTEIGATLELLRKINRKGIALLIIEHNMQAILNISGRIVVLNHGEKIAEGMPEDIVQDREVIKAYLGDEYVISRN